MLQRRHVLKSVGIAGVLLAAGCTTKTDPTTKTTTTVIDPQVLADAQSAVSEASTIVTLVKTNPKVKLTVTDIKNIGEAESAANTLIAGLSNATLAGPGATVLQQIDADINAIAAVVGPILNVVAVADPALTPAVDAYDLLVPLLPAIEAWVNSIILSQGKKTTAPLKPLRTVYTVSQARAKLASRKSTR